jgi:hypothetical protein
MVWTIWLMQSSDACYWRLYDGVSTSELDNLAAETAASMTIAPRLRTVGPNCDLKFTLEH